jgi:predicted negative regulator of RcsB-dependent stress response
VDLEVKRRRFDAALKRLEAVASQTRRPETWLARRGEILQQAGRGAEAQAAYTQALEAIARLPAARRDVPAMRELEKRLRSALDTLAAAPPKTEQ